MFLSVSFQLRLEFIGATKGNPGRHPRENLPCGRMIPLHTPYESGMNRYESPQRRDLTGFYYIFKRTPLIYIFKLSFDLFSPSAKDLPSDLKGPSRPREAIAESPQSRKTP